MLKVSLFAGVILRLFGFLLVGTFFGYSLFYLLTGINFSGSEGILAESKNSEDARSLLLVMQALNSLFVYFALPLAYLFFFNPDLKPIVSIEKKKLGIYIILSLAIFFTALPFISQLIEWNQQIDLPERFEELQQYLIGVEEQAKIVTQMIVFYDYWYEIVPILLVIAVMAGVGEELLFRGIIQNEILAIFRNQHFAVWVSAILFSFIHFQFQGFLPRMVLGGLLGYLYYWSGNLLVPMFTHFINNTFTFAMMNYARHQGETIENTGISFLLIVPITIVCLILLILFYRFAIQVKEKELVEGE